MKRKSRFPSGWTEGRVRKLLEHYETQSDAQAIAEDEAAFERGNETVMRVPRRLVPKVRQLIAKNRRKGTKAG
mgnify:CR=1 FL=1